MTHSGQPPRILIVEDDDLVARSIALRLENMGYAVAGLLDRGEDAVEEASELQPDLILMDIMLAGSMDGIEAAKKIQHSLNIPIIFLTAHADRELVERAFTTAPFAYLQKPLKERELELSLELALLRQRLEIQERTAQQGLQQRISESTAELHSARQSMRKMKLKHHRDQASLLRFSAAVEDSADSIFLIDRASMRFVDANRTASKRLGLSKEELLALGPQDIKPYFNRQMLEQRFDEITALPERFGVIDTFHKCKDGTLFPVEVRLRAIASEDSLMFVAIARDLSEQRESEEIQRQSEKQLRQIAENLQHVLWILDLDSERILYVNPTFEAVCGRPCSQLYKRPRTLLADIHPEDRVRLSSALQGALRNEQMMNEEYRLMHSDGKIHWLWVRTFPIRDDKGRIYRIGAITEDITARREQEETLRLNEEKFRLLFEKSPIGLGLVSNEQRFIEVNPVFCNMLGYSQEELLAKTIAEITHPEDIGTSRENLHKLFNGQLTVYATEKRYIRKNGTPLWVKLHSTIVHDHNKQPLFGMGMVEDIDQMKHAEISRLAHEASHKKALVREVHHRIKNHLQGVVGLMRQNAQTNSQCRGILEDAIAQINVVATIHGLQGKATGEEIDLLEMLAAISHAVNELIPSQFPLHISNEKSLSVTINRDESVPVALALNELVVNAVKYASGPVTISLSGDSKRAAIRISNPTSELAENLCPGSGLELVQALLQTEGSTFGYELRQQQFIADLVLSPPVTKPDGDTPHSMSGEPQ